MPLTNKYLKYSPEITLEIFTLVWDKLISCGWKPYSNQEIQTVWTYLTKNSWYGIKDSGGSKFIQYKNTPLVVFTETTVQEILGYDPFVKEEVVPEYVECIDVATCNTKVGEIFKCRQIDNSFEWEYNNKTIKDYSSWDGWSVPWSSKLPQKHFKSSTKEAFDAQNKPKQPLKQAVHCKTQEEWDFVTEKLNYKWIGSNWYGEDCYINALEKETANKSWWLSRGYQILSFQEWCDLNGYKTEKEVKFEVRDWVCNKKRPDKYIGQITEIKNGYIYYCGHDEIKSVRHATPKEINNHLISIGQIPAGEPLNTGIEPNKDSSYSYSYSYVSANREGNPRCTFNSIKINGQEVLKPKMILSIDDEEFPMVNIIKTNTVKQLLNNN